MKSIQIQLTTNCNERCFMCRKYTWDRKEILLTNLIEKINKYKDCTFTFSGGDPLSYSHLKELNDILSKNNIVYQIFTNMNYELAEDMKIFLDNAKYIQVSLDGSNYETYNSVRRCKENGFNVVKENILKYKDKIKANCTVSNRNYFDVKNIYEFCKDMNIIIRFFPVHTDKNALLMPFMIEHIKNQFIMHNKDIPIEVLIMINNFDTNKNIKFDKCIVKKEHRVIDEYGREFPCCRAINDNGEDWNGKYSIDKLDNIDDENVLYEFCSNCDRYVKFNRDWNEYKDKKELFL